MTDRRIYVACLSCYNAGTLTGRWIDPAEIAEDEVTVDYVHELSGRREPWCEELAVHDHEGFGETHSENVRTFYAAHEAIEALVGLWYEPDSLIAWVNYEGFDWESVDLDDFRDRFAGGFSSDAEFAENELESYTDLEALPSLLRYRIDWNGVWEDFRAAGEYFVIVTNDGSRYYFRSF